MKIAENMEVWGYALGLISSIIISCVLFVASRSKLTEKIDFIEDKQKIIKIIVFISLFSSILFAILYYFIPNSVLLLSLFISVPAFLISELSINSIPQVYIRTKVKGCNKEERPKELEKEKTDIQWKFDDLLGGGLPLGHICMVTGPPGVGVTILGFEILYNGANLRNQKGLFLTMNESKAVLTNRLNTVWKDVDKSSKFRFEEIEVNIPPYPSINWKSIFGRKTPLFSWKYPIYVILREKDKNKELKRVIINLPAFFEEIPKEQIINFFDTLSKIAYEYELLVVVTCLTCESSLEQLAPIVINLDREFQNDGRAISSLLIKKNVGFPSSPTKYEFEIRGLELENNLKYKLQGLVFDEIEGKYRPESKLIPGIWIFETSFKVGEKLHG